MEFSENSHINIPIAVLIWLMMYPMMLKVDFASVLQVRRRPKVRPTPYFNSSLAYGLMRWFKVPQQYRGTGRVDWRIELF